MFAPVKTANSGSAAADGYGADYDSSRSYFDLNELPPSPPQPAPLYTGEDGFKHCSPGMRGTVPVQPAKNRCRTPLRSQDDSYLKDDVDDELEEDKEPSQFSHPKETLAIGLKMEKVLEKHDRYYDRFGSAIDESLTIQSQQRQEKSLRMEQLRKKTVELKLKLAAVEAECEENKRIQQKLDAPVNAKSEKINKKLEGHMQSLKEWKNAKKKTSEKLQKALTEKENSIKLLEWLGVSLVKEQLTERVSCFKGMTFTKIDPANPDTEFTVYFENFDEDSWTFKVTCAQPTFDGFDELAKNFNEDGKLVPFIYGCRKNWAKLSNPQPPLPADSPDSSGSTDLFADEEEEGIQN